MDACQVEAGLGACTHMLASEQEIKNPRMKRRWTK
jgi:hypothetical protein